MGRSGKLRRYKTVRFEPHESMRDVDEVGSAKKLKFSSESSDDVDPGSGSAPKQRTVLIAGTAFVALVLAVVYWRIWGAKKKKKNGSEDNEDDTTAESMGGRRGRERRVRWADEEGGILEVERQRAEDEQAAFLRQEERMQAVSSMEKTLGRINDLKQQFAKNEGELKKTQNNMQDSFGDSAAAYDENLTSFEQEQSLENAFMMKTDLDQKRKGMVDYTEALKKKQGWLMHEANELGKQYQFEQTMYQQRYGTNYVPHHLIAQAEAEARAGAEGGGGTSGQMPLGPPPPGPPRGSGGAGYPIPRNSPPPGTPTHGNPMPAPPPGYDMNMAQRQPIMMTR